MDMHGLRAFTPVSLALAASLCVASSAARASLLFDTITGIPQSGYNTVRFGAGGSPLGNSFSVTDFGQLNRVALSLGAFDRMDGGFVLVYIVPDASGLPSHVGSSTTLDNRTLLGAVSDLSLALAGNSTDPLPITSLSVSYRFSPGNYWIELVDSGNVANGGTGVASSAVWGYNANDAGTGTLNQFFSFNDRNNLIAVADTSGPFRLTLDATLGDVTVPEPTSLLVFGSALIGCRLLSGRRHRQVDHG